MQLKNIAKNIFSGHIEGIVWIKIILHPVDIYLIKVNNRNTRASWEICLKLTIKTPELAMFFSRCSHGKILKYVCSFFNIMYKCFK